MARSLSGEASLEENILLEKFLAEDDVLNQEYNAMKHFWSSPQLHNNAEEDENKKHIEVIFQKAKAGNYSTIFQYKKTRLKPRKVFAIAAGSLLVVACIAVFFSLNKTKNNKPISATINKNIHRLIAENGSRSRTVLPDGSVVWLNAGSVLTYNNFSSTQRQVYLKGEAFFDVAKDAKHPFIVHASSVDIKVLGTAFNVKSYTEDNKVEATLIRGVIQVTRADDKNIKPVFLHPNEKIVIDLKENAVQNNFRADAATEPVFKLFHLDSTVKTENRVETSWVYNRLEIRGENFEELAKKLERWFNIKIFFEDEDVKKLSFYGSFENETVGQAFEALKAAAAFSYNIKEDQVFIKSLNN